jgi:hypothetical protein
MLVAKVVMYDVDEEKDIVRLSLECRYKEFQKVFFTQDIPRGDKLVEDIKGDALKCCKPKILEWVAECDASSIIGTFVPVPADFLTSPVEQVLSSELL